MRLPLKRVNSLEDLNSDEYKESEKRRNEFLAFHYSLGGLLLYKKKYELIYRFFEYTTSEPPRYPLLPITTGEIFNYFFSLRDPFLPRFSNVNYHFPGLDGINSYTAANRWVSSYMTVLFLRQYKKKYNYYAEGALDFPQIPKTQSEKTEWINGLSFFKKLLQEVLDDNEMLAQLELEFITPNYCSTNNLMYPTDYIEELKNRVNEAYEREATALSIDPSKRQMFYDSTKRTIEQKIKSLARALSKAPIKGKFKKWFISGERMIQSKDAFSENPEIHHFDYDSFLSGVLAEKIERALAQTFHLNRTRSYLFKPEEVFQAIQKCATKEMTTLVCFGVDVENYIDYLKVAELTTNKFNNLELISFPNARVQSPTFYLINSENLPFLLQLELQKEVIEEYSPAELSKEFNLYASITDLATASKNVVDRIAKQNEGIDLNKSLLLDIFINFEIRWKEKVELVQFIEYSKYRQEGLPNSLSDIKPN